MKKWKCYLKTQTFDKWSKLIRSQFYNVVNEESKSILDKERLSSVISFDWMCWPHGLFLLHFISSHHVSRTHSEVTELEDKGVQTSFPHHVQKSVKRSEASRENWQLLVSLSSLTNSAAAPKRKKHHLWLQHCKFSIYPVQRNVWKILFIFHRTENRKKPMKIKVKRRWSQQEGTL